MIRGCAAFVAARALLAAVIVPPLPARIVVVTESGVEAFVEAVDGLTARLGAEARVIDIHASRARAELTEALQNRDTQLIVAVGGRALAEVQLRKPGQPVISTMMLRGAAADVAGQVYLDVPLGMQLEAIRSLLPRASRIGMIRNPARSRANAEILESVARKEGYTAVVEDCDGPARLLKLLASLRNRIDVLLCFPDGDLYNPVTIPPLVMAAIEYRLPVFGFSAAFVHAGAAAGVYPDYRALGWQTGELASRLQKSDARSDPSPVEESPSKVCVAVNQRILRLLGLDFRLGTAVEVFR